MLLLTFCLGILVLNRPASAEYIVGEGLVSQIGDIGVELFEMVRTIHSELTQLKREQEKMKAVQEELLTTKEELLKTQKELVTSQEKFFIVQKELKSRVDEIEGKNRHLETHVQKLMTLCKVDNIAEKSKFIEEASLGHGHSDPNTTSDYLQGEQTGNDRKAIIRRSASKNVGFTARLTNTISSMGSLQTIVFDNVYVNAGNSYEASSGIFHAPVAGMYVIMATVASDAASTTTDVEVVHNGSSLCRTIAPWGTFGGSPCNAIAHLNAGDAVWVREINHRPGDRIRGSYFSTFSVGLLSRDDDSSSSS